MKLTSAKIRNFRLLKSIDLDFSTDDNKSLTVIRAANETGKTTTQHALIWCFYGSIALPKRANYSLFPSDLIGHHQSVEVSVEIDFEVEQVTSSLRSQPLSVRNRYRLKRTCTEYPVIQGSPSRRSNEQYLLYEITAHGSNRVLDNEVQSIIENALPFALKDVYFTDGDSAMSFIEAAATDKIKRDRVANAIEALLGLKIIDNTITHLSTIERTFSSEIDNKDYANEVSRLHDNITSYREDIDEWDLLRQEAAEAYPEIQRELARKKLQIEEVLVQGDKSKLIREKKEIEKSIDDTNVSIAAASEELAKMTYSHSMSTFMLADPLSKVILVLQKLSDQKQLPKVHVPVLEELLTRETCFCGTNLQEGEEALRRRHYIEHMIEKSKGADLIQENASSLFYRIRSIDPEGSYESWIKDYSNRANNLQHLESDLNSKSRKLDELNDIIENIKDDQLQILRDQEKRLHDELLKNRSIQDINTARIEDTKSRMQDAERELEKAMLKRGKTDSSTVKMKIAKESKKVFEAIVERLKQDELKKVSYEMNRIFLAMVGSQGEANQALIQRAELTSDYEIKVYGLNGHEINPDQDLNGASRRAITLAFILALTKVSLVEAPNIIDTPLGMMSGYVKQSVLLNTIAEGSQTILFLTHDEIRGVETILDKYAGMVYTLTNPAHYPVMLQNKPENLSSGIVRCECNHHQSCEVCSRKNVEVV